MSSPMEFVTFIETDVSAMDNYSDSNNPCYEYYLSEEESNLGMICNHEIIFLMFTLLTTIISYLY